MLTAPPPPKPVHQLARGTVLRVGPSTASVNAEIDFETYSEAGYVWDAEANKWIAPEGAPGNKKGLPLVGLDNYARHPTAEILMAAYDLKDGRGWRLWLQGLPFPDDLRAHIASGALLEAHNAGFEERMWEHVGVRKYGWPPMPAAQWRCSAAKARAYALPGALGKVGDVLRLDIQKDKAGEALMKKFSMPRNPTKGDPRRRVYLTWDPTHPDYEDSLAYARYCVRDIETEAEVSGRCPDLVGDELEWWQFGQEANAFGMHVDREGLENCAEIVRQCLAHYNAELLALTGIDAASKVKQMTEWLAARGVHTDSLDEENVERLLALPDLPPDCKRVLEIRAAAGSASVKKVHTMLLMVSEDSRLRDLYVTNGARTGRDISVGPQAANLPSAGPAPFKCACGTFFAGGWSCPACRVPLAPSTKPGEWSLGCAEQALRTIASRSLAEVERVWGKGNALQAVAGCLRALYGAAPGYDLISSDYNSIEAVALAMVSGEPWRVKTFNEHGKIYEASAGAMFKIPFEEFMTARGYTPEQLAQPEWWLQDPATPTGKHHKLRKTGKVMELACLAGDTRVLTHRGYKPLIDVDEEDLLWDGQSWVAHQGVVSKGRQQVIDLAGVRMTPDHLVLCNGSWLAANELASNENMLRQAQEQCSVPSPSFARNGMGGSGSGACNAPAAGPGIWSPQPMSARAPQPGAPTARASRPEPLAKISSSTPSTSRTTSIADACSTDSVQPSIAATTRTTPLTQTTGAEASTSRSSGEKIAPSSASTSSPAPAGTTPTLKWTGATSTGGTNLETSASSRSGSTSRTVAPSATSSSESPTSRLVYDIAHAGPRNRFTIATDSGHLVVHNCGYQGWVGSAHAFGMPGTDDEIKASILAWRAASPSIEWLWGGQTHGKANGIRRVGDKWDKAPYLFGVEGAFLAAIRTEGVEYRINRLDGSYTGFSYTRHGDVIWALLPSGRHLKYHRPREAPGKRAGESSMSYEGWNTNPKNGPPGWIRMDTWGGRLVENLIQAICRDILKEAVLRLKAAGYRTVMRTYDEVVCEVPHGFGSHEEFEGIVEQRPQWALDWPIRAPDSWRGARYRKA